MTRIALLASAFAALALGACAPPAQEAPAQNIEPPRTQPRVFERFDGQTQLRTPDGEKTVRLVIQNWIIDGGQKIDQLSLPMQGFLIVQLRGGELTTVINGERQERQEDEFWTVPAGVPMGLETEDDSAIIQTIMISDP